MTDLGGGYEREQTEKLRQELAEATVPWLDPDTGVVWRVPTAYAYAQACKALARAQARRDVLEAQLKVIEAGAR